MSLFEKIIIPLLDDSLNFGDVACLSGFEDAYTSDPDRPFTEPTFYLMYNDTERTEKTALRYKRLESLNTIRYKYIKYINAKPYLVYQFYIKPEVKKLFTGNISLTPEQTIRIIEFWGKSSDVAQFICSNDIKYVYAKHDMPFEDYEGSPFNIIEPIGLRIQKGEATQNE